ncbi:MAG: hypothetical protein EZS28_049242, partial [Streblomastix strix]
CLKIKKVDNGSNVAKDQRCCKFCWQAQVFHSTIQTKKTTSIANKKLNEQGSKSNRLYKGNDSNEEVFDRAVLEDESAGEQQTKNDRQMIELNNNSDISVNFRMRSECEQEQHANQKDVRTIGSGSGKFQLARDTCDIYRAQMLKKKAVDSIQQIEEENGWTLTIRRIAGKSNKDVDALSKLLIVGDYSTKKERLEEVLKGWQVEITVYLFAARIDAQYKSYYTLTKDKKAYGQDAIRIPWEEKFVLIQPPTPKIIRILRKVIKGKAYGVMIVLSLPGQVCWTQLKEITVKEKKLGKISQRYYKWCSITLHFITDYVTHISQEELTSFIQYI